MKTQSKQALREGAGSNLTHCQHRNTQAQPAPRQDRYAVPAAQWLRADLVEVMVELVREEDLPRPGKAKDSRHTRALQLTIQRIDRWPVEIDPERAGAILCKY